MPRRPQMRFRHFGAGFGGFPPASGPAAGWAVPPAFIESDGAAGQIAAALGEDGPFIGGGLQAPLLLHPP
jgi:hypothetical protein